MCASLAFANAEHKVAATIGKKLTPVDACTNTCRSRTPDPEKQPLLRSEAPLPVVAFDKTAHRLQYATELEEKEIIEGMRENPSLDSETQQQILLDYRELHEQIKTEGLYQCNYSAYGWESIRYATLFAAFAYLLYSKWYLTSALFLGLFWVSHPLSLLKYPLTGPSNKSCSQRTMPATAAFQATSLSTL